MKKIITAYVFSLGGEARYSGNTRTMYLNDPFKNQDMQSLEDCIYQKFGFELPFELKTN